jgi:hypothetical protein
MTEHTEPTNGTARCTACTGLVEPLNGNLR